jgi:hypothetical protein
LSRQTKIVLAIVAGLAVLCLAACIVGALLLGAFGQRVTDSVMTEPQQVQDNASTIAEFDLPPGFATESSINMLGIRVAMFTNTQNDHFISLLQIPTRGDINDENIRQLEEAMARGSNRQLADVQTIEERALTVRGEPARLLLQSGTSDGRAYRQLLLAFQGKGGLALLIVMGPEAGWDQPVYDAMIESIR